MKTIDWPTGRHLDKPVLFLFETMRGERKLPSFLADPCPSPVAGSRDAG